MARYLGITGIQIEVVRCKENIEGVIKRLRTVAAFFPWVDIVIFSELCVCGMNSKLAQPIPNGMTSKLCNRTQKEEK